MTGIGTHIIVRRRFALFTNSKEPCSENRAGASGDVFVAWRPRTIKLGDLVQLTISLGAKGKGSPLFELLLGP